MKKKKEFEKLVLLLLSFHQSFHLTELFEEFQDALLIVFDVFERAIFDFVHGFVNLHVITREKMKNRQTMLDLVDLLKHRIVLMTVDSIGEQRLESVVRFGFGGEICNERQTIESNQLDGTYRVSPNCSIRLRSRCLSCREWHPYH